MIINFTQYVLPNGARRPLEIDTDKNPLWTDEYEKMAQHLVDSHCVFEVEILTTGQIHMDCQYGDEVLNSQICGNDSSVYDALIRLVKKSYMEHSGES